MKKIFFLFLFIPLICVGQKTPIDKSSTLVYNKKVTSLYTAKNLKEAYDLIKNARNTVSQDKNKRVASGSFDKPCDIYVEFLRVDTVYESMSWEPEDRYILSLSSNLPIDTYRKLIQYIFKNLYDESNLASMELSSSFIHQIYYIIKAKINIGIDDKDIENEYKAFLSEIFIYQLRIGNFYCFSRPENYQFITDIVCEEARVQLNTPRYSPDLAIQYTNAYKERWDSSLIDTTGIPRKIINGFRIDKTFQNSWTILPYVPKSREEWDLFEQYKDRIYKFFFVKIYAEKHGISSLEEALYKDVEDELYYFVGYKRIDCLLDYLVATKDERLLSAAKKFIKENPDYKLTEKQKSFFDNLE